MKNIFEDAKFGDIFVDADGREMRFVMSDKLEARLLEGDNGTKQWLWRYNLDGTDAFGEVAIWRKGTPERQLMTNVPERQLMTEEYLLGKGFTKDFNDLLNEEYFAGPNNQVTVWRNYDNVPSPYVWYAIINKDDNTRGSMDIAYIDEFETFLKLCRVENYE